MNDLVTDDWMRLTYLMLLLVFLAGGIVLESAGRRNLALRQLATWAMIFAVLAFGASWWQDRQSSARFSDSGDKIEIPLGYDGHYHLQALVNDAPIDFLIDTGATSLVLSPADARKAGLDPDNLAYLGTAMTANGAVRSASVRLDSVKVGPITDHDVRAEVNGAEMDGSLMGMSYLSNFARVSIENEVMVLER